MLFNNLKIAIRTLKKNKIYTFINILGLTVGIAAALLIFRMVTYELSFNKSFEKHDRIVRVVAKVNKSADGEVWSVCTPLPAMEEMKNTVSQFEAFSRVREMWATVTIPNPNGGAPLKKFAFEGGETAFFTDNDLPQIFDFQWLAGDSKTALVEPNSIVLTKKWAEKCFDDWSLAMGKTVMLDNLVPVTIKGVIEDLPSNCDFNFPFLISYETVENNADLFFFGGGWGSCSSNNQVYALLQDANQTEAANTVLSKVGEEEYKDDDGIQRKFHVIQPISDLHYNEDLSNSGTHRTSKTRLKVLSFIGILILIMACFNFINLATAQSILRAKEVGVRKTLGGRPAQLIGQFMSETGLIVIVSIVFGANLASIASPLLKHVSDVPDALPFMANPMVWGFLGLTAVSVTLLAGLYPAMTLASYEPSRALDTRTNASATGATFVRKSLVVLQFAVAQALIIGTIITLLQLDYIQDKDLGFKQDLIYIFNFNSDSSTVSKQTALKQSILQIPSVEMVSFSSDQPMSGNTWQSSFRYSTRPEGEDFSVSLKFCDEDYQKTYGIELLAGEWLTKSDTSKEAVINYTMIKKLQLDNPEDAIGQNIQMGSRTPLKIVGVAKDFHSHSVHRPHEALLMTTRKPYYWEAGVKIRPSDIAGTVAAINKSYDNILPEQVFNGRFLDESIAQFYQDESRLSATCKGFGFLAILISCLGLFGLATHAATQRIKEIGIRKVLGASIGGIIALLSKDFLKLVGVAMIIAAPLAWMFMSSWLDNFVFRIDIEWWVFALSGAVAVLIAFLTVSYQSLKAALASPINSLKSE